MKARAAVMQFESARLTLRIVFEGILCAYVCTYVYVCICIDLSCYIDETASFYSISLRKRKKEKRNKKKENCKKKKRNGRKREKRNIVNLSDAFKKRSERFQRAI